MRVKRGTGVCVIYEGNQITRVRASLPWHIVAHVAQRLNDVRLLVGVQPLRGVRLVADVRAEIVAANHERQQFPVAGPIDPDWFGRPSAINKRYAA